MKEHLPRDHVRRGLNGDEAAGYAREQMQWEREERRREMLGEAAGSLVDLSGPWGRW